jgi:hypothetical protein
MEDKRDIKVVERQGDVYDKVRNQSNSELSSLSPTLSQTRSLEPHCIQIDVQIAYELCFKRSTYA